MLCFTGIALSTQQRSGLWVLIPSSFSFTDENGATLLAGVDLHNVPNLNMCHAAIQIYTSSGSTVGIFIHLVAFFPVPTYYFFLRPDTNRL